MSAIKNINKKNIDFYASLLGIGYIILPILIFLIGFLKFYISIPLVCAVVYSSYRCFKNLYDSNAVIETEKRNIKSISIYILLFYLILVWLFFSGIGSFSFQNDDYMVRNPIFRDLINYKWPVIYDLSEMDSHITSITGTDKVMFVYYFTYWLPSALVGKLFGELAANFALYFWSLLGIVLTLYFVSRYLKKLSYSAIIIFIFFGGLDIVGTLIFKESYQIHSHIEWWNYFQYSSNTTQLYWVFNQSIPAWLITSMLLNCRSRKSVIFISSAIFAYSPFATIGMVPIAIYMYLKRYDEGDNSLKKRIAGGITFENIFMPLMMLTVFGMLYTSNPDSISVKDWAFKLLDCSFAEKITSYLMGIILECGLYFFIIRRYFRNNKILWAALISLILFPFYKITPANDFAMRSSIPALFILMIFVIKYVQSNSNRALIAVVLVISSVTAVSEISRSVHYTFSVQPDSYLKEDIYSFGDMKKPSDRWINTVSYQFFAHDYENTPFYKYIAKHNEEDN